jgi:hypothetical protein
LKIIFFPLKHSESHKFILIIAIAFIFIQGCSKNHLETAKVHGIVTLDGRPLEAGVVLFRPGKGRLAVGKIRPDGSYELLTYVKGGNDGAIIGRHRVTVGPPPFLGESTEQLITKQPIPEKYLHEGSSGLEFDVKGDVENVIDIKLYTQFQGLNNKKGS